MAPTCCPIVSTRMRCLSFKDGARSRTIVLVRVPVGVYHALSGTSRTLSYGREGARDSDDIAIHTRLGRTSPADCRRQ
jgi:hypothetical protein